jgi:hypothetical protein
MKEASPMRRGDRVIIRRNPHQSGASGIVGTVVGRKADVFGPGVDEYTVRYRHPLDGKRYILPFGPIYLVEATEAALVVLAERYEARAAEVRKVIKRLKRAGHDGA